MAASVTTASKLNVNTSSSQLGGRKQNFSSNGKAYSSSSLNITNKDQLLFKKSNLESTTVRFWNNIIFNPNNVVNKANNSNPMMPGFF